MQKKSGVCLYYHCNLGCHPGKDVVEGTEFHPACQEHIILSFLTTKTGIDLGAGTQNESC